MAATFHPRLHLPPLPHPSSPSPSLSWTSSFPIHSRSSFPSLLHSSCKSGSPYDVVKSASIVICASRRENGSADAVNESDKVSVSEHDYKLRNRILSGEFTVDSPVTAITKLRKLLEKFGQPGRSIAQILENWEYNYLQESAKQIPEARGDVRSITGEPFFIPLYDLYLTYGGIFRLTFGPKSFLIVSDPMIAKRILRDNAKAYSKGILAEILDFVMGKGLIPAEDEIWRVRRRAIVPALHKKYVAEMVGLFGRAALNLCKKLDAAASNGEDVEMESLFSRLTLDIIGKAVFNYDFDSLSHDTGIVEAVYVVLREAEDRSVSVIPYWNIPIIKDLFPRQRKVARALKLINTTLDDVVAVCKKMVEEENVNFNDDYLNEKDPSILHFLLASGDDVSSKQLRDDLMTLLIAGHETSAAVLTWAFYLLAKNPAILSKLQQEVDLVLGDRIPTIEDMRKLKYTTRVINETLRLYPEPPVLIRRSLEDDVLGGYQISKGEDIFISVWNLHRSPSLWEDEGEFRPERWPVDGADPNEVTENFKYLPFGGGARKCIGDMFATFENISAIAMIVRRFDFELAVGAPPVGMTTGATIHTTAGMHLTLTRRMKPLVIPVTGEPALTTIGEDGTFKVEKSINATEIKENQGLAT